jgi:hypothetical protein
LISAPAPRVWGMGVVETVADIAEVAVMLAGGLVVLCWALSMLEALLELIARVAARRRDPWEDFQPQPLRPILRPRPALTLLVSHDVGKGVLRPGVQVRGAGGDRPGSIRIELIDEDERLRLSVCRPFPADASGRELAFPEFAPPEGATVEEALRWHWDVVLQLGGDEPLRWREHPLPLEGVNAEGELVCPVA